MCEHSGDALRQSAKRVGLRVPLSSDESCQGCSPQPFPNLCQTALVSARLADADSNLSDKEVFGWFLAFLCLTKSQRHAAVTVVALLPWPLHCFLAAFVAGVIKQLW